MKIGFIGLGIMGRPMAGHLAQAGHDLFLHSRSGVPAGMAGTPCDTPGAVAAAAEVIIVMVPDTPDVERVLFGDAGVAAALAPGKTVIDMSSISPIATRDFARRVAETGAGYLDAPVSGGQVGAAAASLTIMVGGEEALFERMRPLFEAMGKNITRIGEVGAGQTAKVANQIIVALTIEAVAEGLLFAQRAGADPARVRQALTGGLATSRILELHGQRMIDRSFDPGFRIELHRKDLGLALDGARDLGLHLPGTANAQALFDACIAMGGRAWDHSGLIQALETGEPTPT